MRFPGFIGASYQLKSVNVDCQRLINLYPEIDETGSGKEKEVMSLAGTPGLSSPLATLAGGAHRGSWKASNGQCYMVAGNKLYSVSTSYAATELGTLNSSAGRVSMSDNGIQLVVVDGTYGYVWTFGSASFAQITDPDFPGATHVCFSDGYFIFVKPNSGQFFISGLNDVTFDALDIASSEGSPDNVVACLANQRDIWMFNTQSTEVFYDSGNADFPFERIQGAFIEHGCAAAFSIAKMDNTVFWLGQDDKGAGIVYRASGYQPQRISTTAIEGAIQSYSDFTDATAYSYQENGHEFYVLNFPTGKATWAYDASTGLWHERAYNNNGTLERHRAETYVYFNGKHLVGDYDTGKLYAMSSDVYTDNGAYITRRRRAPHLSADGNLIFYSRFQLDMETGTGIDGSGQGTDPQVMLRFSDDGGHTWSNEKWVGFGKIGQRRQRARWLRLGASRDRVYEVTITDPNKIALIGADIDFEVGAS